MKTIEELNEKARYWYNVIKEQERSKRGSTKEYCEKNQIGIKSLSRWKKIFRDKGLIDKETRKTENKFQTIPIIRPMQQPEAETILEKNEMNKRQASYRN